MQSQPVVIFLLMALLSGCLDESPRALPEDSQNDPADLTLHKMPAWANETVSFTSTNGTFFATSQDAEQLVVSFNVAKPTVVRSIEIDFVTHAENFPDRIVGMWHLWRTGGEPVLTGGTFLYPRVAGVSAGEQSLSLNPYQATTAIIDGGTDGASGFRFHSSEEVVLKPGTWNLAFGVPYAEDAEVSVTIEPDLPLASIPYLGPGCDIVSPEDFGSEFSSGVLFGAGAMIGGSHAFHVERSFFGYVDRGTLLSHDYMFTSPDGTATHHESFAGSGTGDMTKWVFYDDMPGTHSLEIDHSVSALGGELFFYYCMGPY